MASKYALPVLKDATCKHGFDRDNTCDLLGPELHQAGLPALNPCSSCNMPKSLELLSILDKSNAVSALQKLGLWQQARTLTADVTCPVHEEPIVTDCSLSECSFHTTYPGVRNCILVYMHKHKVDTLSTLELSMILGIPHKTIVDDTNRALSFLRQESISTTSGYDIEPRFVVLQNLPVCSVCESPLSEDVIEDRGHKYCSEKCAVSKSVQVLSLESATGVEIRDVLAWATNKYNSPTTLEEALGVPPWLLESLLQEHLGCGLADLYPDDEPATPITLGKRVGRAPTWLAAFGEKTAQIQEAMVKKYGSVLVDLSELQQEFDKLS